MTIEGQFGLETRHISLASILSLPVYYSRFNNVCDLDASMFSFPNSK
jgi:hypothetical protein